MPDYRIYKLNARGHVTGPALVLVCEKDADVIRKIESLIDGHDVEILEGARLVARLKSGAAYAVATHLSPAQVMQAQEMARECEASSFKDCD